MKETWFNTQSGNGEFHLQFGTHSKEQYELMQTVARLCVDHNDAHLHDLLAAEKDGRLVVLPCKVGDICYEVDPGHPGVIKHTVTGTTVYNRRADGNRYMTDFVNVITIETYAVAKDGCEWADQYTAEEWTDQLPSQRYGAASGRICKTGIRNSKSTWRRFDARR